MTETPILFRSDMTVEAVRVSASDDDVLAAARVSTVGELSRQQLDSEGPLSERDQGLINFLMRDRHGSPLEHNRFTFFVQAPIFVFREFQRHRIASYNEESGRYRTLQPVFYVPGPARNMRQVGKPGQYRFETGTPEQHELVAESIREASITGYRNYERMLAAGVAREVARMSLTLNLYSSMYVTMNARSMMNFLSLRVLDEDSLFPSFPQREIELVAEQIEAVFREHMPVAAALFAKHRRVAP